MELNDFLLAEDDDARKAATESNTPKKKTNYIRLKDGQQVRGFLLTTAFKVFMQHGDFTRKIHSHVCKDPKNGKTCLSCQNGVTRNKIWIVPFYDVDAKEIRIFEAKKKYMNAIYTFVDQYEDEATTTPIVFSRAGSDAQSTSYTLMPTRVKANEKDLFVLPTGIELSTEFYMSILNPPSDEYLTELLGISNEEIKLIDDDVDPNDVISKMF